MKKLLLTLVTVLMVSSPAIAETTFIPDQIINTCENIDNTVIVECYAFRTITNDKNYMDGCTASDGWKSKKMSVTEYFKMKAQDGNYLTITAHYQTYFSKWIITGCLR